MQDEFVRFARAAVVEACSFYTAEQSLWHIWQQGLNSWFD
jgi:hypothetical protein